MDKRKRIEDFRSNSIKFSEPLISVNMLLTDKTRWDVFSEARLGEFQLEVDNGLKLEAVLIVNNPGTPDFKNQVGRTIARYTFPIKVFFHKENNIPKARNLASRFSKGTYLYIVDDDVEVSTGTLQFMVDCLKKFPLGVIGMRVFDLQKNHFKPSVDMPRLEHSLYPNLLFVAGVHGMGFLTFRKLAWDLPLSETRTLRGEWVEWFTRLWRAGIPSAYYYDPRFYAIDKYLVDIDGKAKSATRYDERLLHALISMIHLAFEYELKERTMSWDLLRDKYVAPNLGVEGKPTWLDEFWQRLVKEASHLKGNTSAIKIAETIIYKLGISDSVRSYLELAFKHCIESISEMKAFKEEYILNAKRIAFPVTPFEIFEPRNRHLLEKCIEGAEEKIESFRKG